ncbi:SPFH domain-containing protein [Pseudomonadota bacterium]|uniref:SPFH domain-containing protein n=1 Tax=unclassified Shewanella TaxID=196818 RepID=UPI000C81CBA6|nr:MULTISPECIES: slipin family protein [unclassified Shewanella]MDO6619413.1 SPFH domain-containing protein [Shewanella sp. 6_MG-2023]MDO6641956.1 SPFH domain-containing protein [Shewanella sp. 5_MG-2023]MDO6680309.1 SPFH domain-containing protein [Shewanella sp. 4_MG-2023]MDO6775332.1 SPFH domain-containing protein [Shewanella sp. 3_MG-2023]PMG27337.1 paraslipin [Shewanella sp. 10N.286.52.C2]
MFELTIAILFIFFILYKLMLIVPMREVNVIERLGKFRTVLQPGFHFLVPFVDRVAYRHDTREEVLDVPPQSCISKDNTQLEVDGLVYLKVMDGKLASYGIENYRKAAVNLAQTTMRSEIGKLTLSQTFSERDSLNESIVREIDKASDPWGIKVLRYEIKNISPSIHVIHTLEKQMEAERRKRAEITLANAEKDAMINISQGERQEAINLSEGQKRKRINEAIGSGQEITIIAKAKAEGMDMICTALANQGGNDAMNMMLKEQFISQVGDILTETQVSVVPAEMAKLEGFFEGMEQVTHAVTNSPVKGAR